MRSGPLERCLGALSALFLVIVAVACSLPAPCIERVAQIPAGAEDRVRAALAGDAAPWTDAQDQPVSSRRGRLDDPPVLALQTTTGDLHALVRVERSPDRVRVLVRRFGGGMDEAARAGFLARADDVCARIVAACPEIGEWEQIDDGTVEGPGMGLIIAPVVLVAVIVFAVVRERRRVRRLASPPKS